MKTKFFKVGAAIFAVAMSLHACKQHEADEYLPENAVRFSSNINLTIATKASDASWSANDEIGIYMVGNGTTDVVDGTLNRRYVTASGDGAFSAANDQLIYYPQDGSAVDFLAYYPYQSSITTLGNYNVDVADQSDPELIDLLYAKATNEGDGYSSDYTSSVELQFHHRLSRLRLQVESPAEELDISAEELAGMTAVISGLKTKATFSLADGTLSEADDAAPISLRSVTGGTLYDAIILPENIAADVAQVTFTAGSKTFVWEVPASTIESGLSYTATITLVRDGVAAGVIGEIVDWEEIVVEEPEPGPDPKPDPESSPITTVSIERIVPAVGTKTIPTKMLETQAGDYIFVYAHNDEAGSGHAPEAPDGGGYTQLAGTNSTGSTRRTVRLFSKVATGTSTELGEWTITNGIFVVVLRGIDAVVGAALHNGDNIGVNEHWFPAVAEFGTGGPNYLLGLASTTAHRNVVAVSPGFEVIWPTSLSGYPQFWAGITKEAYTTQPAYTITYNNAYGGHIRASVALRAK